jgi:hypothetical protein
VRERFDHLPLSATARVVLAREAEGGHGWLQWVDSEQHRTALAVLSDRADRIERADPAIRAELMSWRHDGEHATDGIGATALPLLGPGQRASDIPLRDFGVVDGEPGDVDPQRLPLPAEHPDLAVLCTRYEGLTSWLQAGEATARLLLRITSLGLAASPLGQVLDLPWTRSRVRAELATTGHPQLVLRLGHARLAGPRSPRRQVEEVLTDAGRTSPVP